MNFFQTLEQTVEKLIHPEAKAALAALAAGLQANKAALASQYAIAGGTVASFVRNEVESLVTKEPAVAAFAPFIFPLLSDFVDKEIGYGASDLNATIDKIAAWLIAEEANV